MSTAIAEHPLGRAFRERYEFRRALAERQQAQHAAGAAATPLELAARAGLALDPWQQRFAASTAMRILLNCSRQSGKSTMSALLAVHTALAQPGSLTLLVSRAERQSAELMRKVQDLYSAIERPVAAVGDAMLRLELANRSRIIALPGSEETIRSFSSVALAIIDEASRVPDATYFSIRPMLAVSGGRLICPSTPFGERGWWYEAWTGAEDWERYEIPATQCPRISAEFLAEERAALGEHWFRQEYLCEFVATVDNPFDMDLVRAAFTDDVAPLFGAD